VQQHENKHRRLQPHKNSTQNAETQPKLKLHTTRTEKMSLEDQTVKQPKEDNPLFIPANQQKPEEKQKIIWENGELIQ